MLRFRCSRGPPLPLTGVSIPWFPFGSLPVRSPGRVGHFQALPITDDSPVNMHVGLGVDTDPLSPGEAPRGGAAEARGAAVNA